MCAAVRVHGRTWASSPGVLHGHDSHACRARCVLTVYVGVFASVLAGPFFCPVYGCPVCVLCAVCVQALVGKAALGAGTQCTPAPSTWCIRCARRTWTLSVCVRCTCVCTLGVGAHSGRSSEGQGWPCGWAGEGLQGSALRARLPGPAAQLTRAQGERIACRDLEARGSPRAGTCTGCWYHSDALTPASPPGREEGGRSWGPLLPFDIWSPKVFCLWDPCCL